MNLDNLTVIGGRIIEKVLRCPRCKSTQVDLFPNCTRTFGCVNCGNAFVAKGGKTKK